MSIIFPLSLLWLSAVAQADEFEKSFSQKSQITDISTQTVPHTHYSISLLQQRYGLSNRLQIGSSLLFPLTGGASFSAKAQIYQRKYRHFSLERQWGYLNLSQSKASRHLIIQPTMLTMGRPRRERLIIYTQYQHLLLRARGDFSPQEFQQAARELTGQPIQLPPNLGASLSSNLVIHTLSFTTEWQRKENRTFLFYGQYSLWANGYIIGGVQQQTELGTLDAGAGAYLRSPLYTIAPLALVVAHQWDWNRLHLRLGIPIASGPNVLFLLPKAFSLYWTF